MLAKRFDTSLRSRDLNPSHRHQRARQREAELALFRDGLDQLSPAGRKVLRLVVSRLLFDGIWFENTLLLIRNKLPIKGGRVGRVIAHARSGEATAE